MKCRISKFSKHESTQKILLIQGEIADYHLDEDGILYSYSKNSVKTVKNISENIALVKQITGGKKYHY